ncbi:MAG TPA: hypothetical protein VF292_08675 [Rhodanobacteraceae bacterium]
MNTIRNAVLVAACLASGALWAQSATSPLNLKLPAQGAIPPPAMSTGTPPAAAPASGSTAPAPAGIPATARPNATAPGAYYGDTSGRTYTSDRRVARAPKCDDSTYNQPQTHGSIGMGVMGGRHMSGNYQTGSVSVTKNLGSCEDPTGSVGFSISVGQGRFGGHHW